MINKSKMRRVDRKINSLKDIFSIIQKCNDCVISMNNGKYPYVVPMNFAPKQNKDNSISLYFHGANAGTKLNLIRKDPHVSFSMHCGTRFVKGPKACNSTMKYESVCGNGKVTILGEGKKDLEEKLEALGLITRHFSPESKHKFTEREASLVAVYRLDVNEISGKANL